MGNGKGVERVDVVVEDEFPRWEGEAVEGEAEEEEEGAAETALPSAVRGGRKSQVDAVLQRVGGDDEDDGQEEGEAAQGWRPYVRLTFHGPHVFAGIRQLVECGIIDGERMPGWMTGEEGVTIGAVRHGRIRGHKGSGL
ncbi:9d16dfb0-0116-4416-be70-d0fb55a7dc21 [Thermothielavioides terrestris]|uniref:9d16dfb0-0116-4416-be70-d0fb55a7dc21 n=1 Tax=Thermothielavioides terrestris TaxID=2587410 RepID=A0A3S4BHU1_9PEZI|nr:9d16dfb0-0116-4416-be70-d0fb55a7dc21 [Thermothielavioides terrestris]